MEIEDQIRTRLMNNMLKKFPDAKRLSVRTEYQEEELEIRVELHNDDDSMSVVAFCDIPHIWAINGRDDKIRARLKDFWKRVEGEYYDSD